MASPLTEPLLKSTTEGGGAGDGAADEQEIWSQKMEQWAQWAQFVVPAADDGPIKLSPQEIREAATENPYPQWIFAALVTPENAPEVALAQGNAPPVKPVIDNLTPLELHSVQGYEEAEIRALLIDHVDNECCWFRQPAHQWPIKKVEDCNAYVGTLESFVEERELVEEVEPHSGGAYAAQEYGRIPGPWEVDVRDEFPLLFTPKKEARIKLPFSQRVENCGDCSGRGEVQCPPCHADAQPGVFSPGQMTSCSACYGRGWLAHQDGSDTNCARCQGRGNLPCSVCNSRGLVKCDTCGGSGSLLYSKTLIVKWRTLANKKVSASSHAESVPDEVVLHVEAGAQIYADQSHRCKPVQFPNSYGLSKLSTDLFSNAVPIPSSARLICQRHQLRMVPVTRVVMGQRQESFDFYIVGLSRILYLKNYPHTCSLVCCCTQMCTIS